MSSHSSIHSQISLFFENGFVFCLKLSILVFGQKSKSLRYFSSKQNQAGDAYSGKIDLQWNNR